MQGDGGCPSTRYRTQAFRVVHCAVQDGVSGVVPTLPPGATARREVQPAVPEGTGTAGRAWGYMPRSVGGGVAQGGIVEMGVDVGGRPEQLSHGGKPDAVHDALRGVAAR